MSKELFSGHGWKVLFESAKFPDGRMKSIARVHRCDAVHILAFTDEGNVLLLREYRPFFHDFVWMLPTGKIDKETDIAAAAQRELREETGYRATILQPYGMCHMAEGIAIRNHLFIARDLVKDPLPQDHAEMIEVHELPVPEAIDRVLSSAFLHTVSAYALLRYAREQDL